MRILDPMRSQGMDTDVVLPSRQICRRAINDQVRQKCFQTPSVLAISAASLVIPLAPAASSHKATECALEFAPRQQSVREGASMKQPELYRTPESAAIWAATTGA